MNASVGAIVAFEVEDSDDDDDEGNVDLAKDDELDVVAVSHETLLFCIDVKISKQF